MPSETSRKILQRLEEWKQKDGQLPDIVDLYCRLLRLQAEVEQHTLAPKPTLTKDAINDRLGQGTPLLTFESLSPDSRLLQGLFQRIADTIVEHSAVLPTDAKNLRRVASSNSLLQEVVKAWYDGTPLPEAEPGASQTLLIATTQATLHPFLILQAEALMPLVNQESWRRGYCPICGGKPDIAWLTKETGARWLLCSRCDAQWLFQRLECPYCGTQNQDALAYFTDSDGLYRLYVCEECRSYIKAIDLRRTESEILLPLERVLTLDLDRQGYEAGYKAGWTVIAP
ncbi:formate dehydrogenase accessory protein FdhE [Chloroflexota bacterium]